MYILRKRDERQVTASVRFYGSVDICKSSEHVKQTNKIYIHPFKYCLKILKLIDNFNNEDHFIFI